MRLKAATFGQDLSSSGGTNSGGTNSGGTNSGGNSGGNSYKVRPDVVAALYEQWVMPLTKQVEVSGMGMGGGWGRMLGCA